MTKLFDTNGSTNHSQPTRKKAQLQPRKLDRRILLSATVIDGDMIEDLVIDCPDADPALALAAGTESILISDVGSNLTPDAINDTFGVLESHSAADATGFNVLTNDTDPDGNQLFVVEVEANSDNVGEWIAGRSGGLFRVNSNGSVDFDANGDFDDLAEGERTDTFVNVKVSDGQGGYDIASVCAKVIGTADNTSPDGLNDVETVFEDFNGTLRVNLLANDSDADGDALAITAVEGDSSLVGQWVEGRNGGLFRVNANGSVDFDANGDFEELAAGERDGTFINVRVSDGNGGFDITSICAKVIGKDEGVDAINDVEGVYNNFNGRIDDSVLANDIADNGGPLTVTAVEGDGASVGEWIEARNGGLIRINADGTVDFDTNGEFNNLAAGQIVDTFVNVTVSDSEGNTDIASMCLKVVGRATPNIDAVDDVFSTTEGTSISGDVVQNDNAFLTGDREVTLVDGPNNGTVILNPNGQFTYTPAAGFTGTDTFEYQLDDGNGNVDVAVVQIDVDETCDEPHEVFTYDIVDPVMEGVDVGDVKRLTATYNSDTDDFTFKMVMANDQTNGFTLALNDGPMPLDNDDEMAMIFFDNSGDQPVVTAHNYIEMRDFASYNGAKLASSLRADSPFYGIDVSTDADGNTVYCFSMDATVIQQSSNGPNWTGVSFNESIGVWLFPIRNLGTTYGADGYIDSLTYQDHGIYDVAGQSASRELKDC